jgi:hypothetical protein
MGSGDLLLDNINCLPPGFNYSGLNYCICAIFMKTFQLSIKVLTLPEFNIICYERSIFL